MTRYETVFFHPLNLKVIVIEINAIWLIGYRNVAESNPMPSH